ncbi:ABC transporter substrate-binding protein [Shinella fusca]|jgi:iron complex transport system substrate-binding protein|uniref:Iron complex transport system substrate-binding protein n=1 Tax=Shinella fusca TaxID=544480 RepID=A0A7W7YWT1_9HYPH|nr:ABC transporter substrate-binding protein [Shinella fusca]MBB5043587.1 iron complex transport system substrate-binding protein [Shinella fusca]
MISLFKTPLRAGFLLASLATAVLAGHAQAAETAYPLTLQNCGRQITIDKAPTKTVSIGQSSTEILYLLGLADKVVGTALWVGPVLKGYEEVNARIDRLADNDPSFESVLARKPDLVTVQFQWQVGPEGVVARPEQFEELGIPVYTSPSDCVGKENSAASDGVRHQVFTMDLVYREIRELAKIYNVQDKGEAVVADLKAREAAARAKVASAKGKLSAVFWFSSAADADPYVAGRNGAPGYIMSALGIENIIKTDDEWPTVGWETIARANPTMIVAGSMERRRYPLDSLEAKLDFLKSDPVASLMPAVAKGYVFDMDAQAMNPTIRTIEGIELLADSIAKAGLAQ